MDESYGTFVGDLFFIAALILLLYRIIKKKTCTGFSGKTQIIYTMVYTTKTAHLIFSSPSVSVYYVLKIIIFSVLHFIILYIFYHKYTKTYEREYDKFWIEAIILVSLCVALLESTDLSSPSCIIEAFSGYLEALVFIPQIYFTYRSERYHKIVLRYMTLLILYDIFYIFHYIDKIGKKDAYWDPYLEYSIVVSCIIGTTYFLLILFLKKEDKIPVVLPIKRPQLMHQSSLLESPFLRRSMPSSSSIYTISMDGGSNSSTPNGSVKDLKVEGRF